MVAQGPQIDPRIPNRPQHPDFWALVQAVGAVEDELEACEDIEEIMAPIVDPECLFYMAEGRTTNVAAKLHSAGLPMMPPMVWLDGFLAGAQYRAAKDQLELAASDPARTVDVEPTTVSDELIEPAEPARRRTRVRWNDVDPIDDEDDEPRVRQRLLSTPNERNER